MKKLFYLVAFAFISIVSVPIGAQTQKPWAKNPLPIKKTQRNFPYSPDGKLKQEPANISIQRNPFKTISLATADGKEMYGFSMRNEDSLDEQGFFKFTSNDPTNITRIGTFTKSVRGGAEANGIYYVISLYQMYPEGLFSVNLETGEMTLIVDYMYNESVRGTIDMSYDYSTETMYFITNSDVNNTTALRTVDLKDGTQQVICEDMGFYFRTLAINYDGEMYGVDREANLYKINKENGTSTLIGATGVNLFFWQSMEFDKGTGTLYWASFTTDDASILYIVNTTDGSVTPLGTIGKNEQTVGLYIPFDLCAPEAPAAVTDLTVTPDAKGEKSVILNWKNPDKTYEEKALTSIDKIEILRNGELVKTLTNPKPGQTSTWTDNVPEAGMYAYKLIPYNIIGAGVPKIATAYIGHDIPAAVENAVATRVDSKTILLKWDAATAGVNKGYLDLASIRYKITRNDGEVIAENLTVTTYSDRTIETLKRYTYDIEVSNVDGTGGITTTNYVVTGPIQAIPFIADYANEESANLWTIVDNNEDGNTFTLQFNFRLNVTEYAYYTSFDFQADDWLVSPILNFQADKHYKVIAKAKRSAEWQPETFGIYLVKNMNVADSVKIGEFKVTNYDPEPFRVNIDNIGGEYSVAIRCTSVPAADYFSITKVTVEENHDGNLRGDVYDDKNNPVEGATVSIEGTDFSAITDKDGAFEIKNVPAGEYTVKCSKLGYWDSTYSVTINKLESKNIELDIIARAFYTVTGTVKNEYEEILPNVKITIEGYHIYTAHTDKNGKFIIEGVYEDNESYQIKTTKAFYQEASKEISIKNSDIDVTLTAKDKILRPALAEVTVPAETENPTIKWTKPGENACIKYHSDNFTSTFGTQEGDSKVIYGILCKKPFLIERMNWNLLLEDEEINVVILALDETGEVTPQILYIDEHAANMPWDATNYELLTPVAAPNGCFVGISCNEGSINLIMVASTDEYPYVEGINGYIEDYTQPELKFVEDLGDDYRENFYIDFEGKRLADDEAPSITYNVSRMNSANEESLLTASPISSQTYEDLQWMSLNTGEYGYKVEAVYRNNECSEQTSTDKITKTLNSIKETGAEEGYVKVAQDGNSILFSVQMDEVQLLSVDGKILVHANKISKIDTENINEGIYLVKMNKDRKQYLRKVILNK